MSIDTYDTLAMVRPGALGMYDLDWIEQMVRDLANGTEASVQRRCNELGSAFIRLARSGIELRIYYSDEPHVLAESNEIADDCDGLCRGSTCRFELLGTDLDLVLMTDHQLICERLHATGDFVLYSGHAGLLFDERC